MAQRLGDHGLMVDALTVYLMAPDVESPRDALREGVTVEVIPLRQDLPYTGELYVAPREPRPPSWADLLADLVAGDAPQVTSQFPAAVLAISVDSRVLALTFGLGRVLLNLERAEVDFGLKVTLNTVDPERLESLDTAIIEDLVIRTRRQLSRAANAAAFGIDDTRDMFRAVVGRPRDPTFARRIGGSTSLKLVRAVDGAGLGDLGSRLISAYAGTAYKQHFGFIDRVRPLDAALEAERLDRHLIEVVRGEREGAPYLAAPSIVDWDQIDGFRYQGESKHTPSRPELDYYEAINGLGDQNDLTLEDLRRQTIRVVGTDGQETTRWSIYKCLVWEEEHESRRYILSEGRWFVVDADFAGDIDERVARIPKSNFALPASDHGEEEGTYNERVAVAPLLLFDKDLLTVGPGRYTSIEICDILDPDEKRLIHVKRKTRSSTLSHLLAQGRISAAAVKGDRKFREEFGAKIARKSDAHADLLREPFRATEWEVVYGIVAPNAADLPEALSFFSKLNLVHAADLVAGALDFQLSILGIQEEPASR